MTNAFGKAAETYDRHGGTIALMLVEEDTAVSVARLLNGVGQSLKDAILDKFIADPANWELDIEFRMQRIEEEDID